MLPMSRFGVALAIATMTFAAALPASAQDLGTKGDMVFGVERIFGIRGERMELERPDPPGDLEISQTTISLGLARELVPYNIPRATFDYFIADHWNIGGALGFASGDADSDPGGSQTTTDFVLAPRGGYLHMFGRVVGIWPRAGLTYHSTSQEDEYSEWTMALTLECQFPIVIRQHFGVLLGVAFDQSFLGNRNPEDGPDEDVDYRSIGIQVAMFGWI
jgi:hypothetical protein